MDYLYLTTTGHKSGQPHEIEIWFVEHDGRYYLVAQRREASHWVQNIQHDPAISFKVGSREAGAVSGIGRIVEPEAEPDLVGAVSKLMDAKYGWSTGLIVELRGGTG